MRKLLCIVVVIGLLFGLVGCGTTDLFKKAERMGYKTEITEPVPGQQIVKFSLPEGNKYNRSAYLVIYSLEDSPKISFSSVDSDYLSLSQLKDLNGNIPFESIPPAGCYKAILNLKGDVEKDKEGKPVFTTTQREQIEAILSAMQGNKELIPTLYSSVILPSQLGERNVRIIANDIELPRLDLCFDASPDKAYRIILIPGAEGYVNIFAAGIEKNGDSVTITRVNDHLTIEGSFEWNAELEQWDISPSVLKLIVEASKGDYSNFHY